MWKQIKLFGQAWVCIIIQLAELAGGLDWPTGPYWVFVTLMLGKNGGTVTLL